MLHVKQSYSSRCPQCPRSPVPVDRKVRSVTVGLTRAAAGLDPPLGWVLDFLGFVSNKQTREKPPASAVFAGRG